MKKIKNKVLIINDDEYSNSLYRNLYKDKDFKVDIAKKGKSGLQKLLKNKYDLIHLDILLPDISGLEIIDQLKKKKIKQGKIIFVTNIGTPEVMKEALAKGAEFYIIETNFTPEEIVNKTKECLEEKDS